MVIIGTPSRDMVQATFAYDLVRLIQKSKDASFAIALGSVLPNLRTELVRKTIESHASHILFIDSDMRFPEDALQRLLAHKLDIVGANCKHKGRNEWTANIDSKGKTGLEQVNKIGFGVTLIRIDVFWKIKEPWFGMPFDGQKYVGEDVFFYHKAKENGFEIYVDHDLSQEVKHSGIKEY